MFSVEKKNQEDRLVKGEININSKISFSAFDAIDEIAGEWKNLTKSLPVFYSYEFLKSVENCPPLGLTNKYILCYNEGEVYGILNCQIKTFHASESIQFKEHENPVNKVSTKVKSGIAKMISFQGIVCGSILLTGNYSFHFFRNDLSYKEQFLLAEEIIEAYRLHLNKHGHSLKVTFLKDFYTDQSFSKQKITESKYKEFSVQPNMILNLRKEWKSFEDYLNAFQSKYRVRAKRARKKLEGIERRELDFVDIKKYNSQLYTLYRNIVDNINFNLFYLHEDYFAELKKNMKNKFRIFGYFKEDEMVAFYTCIDNGEEMNAHFLGYDPEANKEHQLYLNSLYDMVELSLNYRFTSINFSRTAMEIKSSVGAEPHDMLCYLKHQSSLINTVTAKIVNALNPTEEWIQRRPFKD